jgi:hypothetical protein
MAQSPSLAAVAAAGLSAFTGAISFHRHSEARLKRPQRREHPIARTVDRKLTDPDQVPTLPLVRMDNFGDGLHAPDRAIETIKDNFVISLHNSLSVVSIDGRSKQPAMDAHGRAC